MNNKKIIKHGFEFIELDKDLFDGYMAEEHNGIIISHITSKNKGKGNFSKLINELKNKYKYIKIPTPSNQMREISKHLGFVEKIQWFPEPLNEYGEIMYWEKPFTSNIIK